MKFLDKSIQEQLRQATWWDWGTLNALHHWSISERAVLSFNGHHYGIGLVSSKKKVVTLFTWTLRPSNSYHFDFEGDSEVVAASYIMPEETSLGAHELFQILFNFPVPMRLQCSLEVKEQMFCHFEKTCKTIPPLQARNDFISTGKLDWALIYSNESPNVPILSLPYQ